MYSGSLFGVRIRVDHTGLADDLPGELPPRPGKEGVVARLVREHRGEVRPSGVPADEEALGEVGLEEGRVLDNLEVAMNDTDWVRDEVDNDMCVPI